MLGGARRGRGSASTVSPRHRRPGSPHLLTRPGRRTSWRRRPGCATIRLHEFAHRTAADLTVDQQTARSWISERDLLGDWPEAAVEFEAVRACGSSRPSWETGPARPVQYELSPTVFDEAMAWMAETGTRWDERLRRLQARAVSPSGAPRSRRDR